MWKMTKIEFILDAIEHIKKVYDNATRDRKRFIEEWIEGIVIDKSGDRENQKGVLSKC